MKGNWKEFNLGELGFLKSSGVDKLFRDGEKVSKLVNYMDVYKYSVIDNNFELSKTTVNSQQIVSFDLREGDVLFTPSSETPDDIGHSSVVIEDLINTVYSYHLIRLRDTSNLLDTAFKAYVFKENSVLKQFSQKAAGSTRYTLTKGSFEKTIVSFPKDKIYQQKIAKILNTIDAVIEKTEQAIAKYQAIKKGMMHDLFTRGIDLKTGKLRPCYEEAPELYKDSELGMIPKDWEYLIFSDISVVNQGLQIAIEQRFSEEGLNRYLYITIQYLNNPQSTHYKYFVKNPPQSVVCEKDDVLMVRTGNTGMVVTDIEGVFHNNFFNIKYSKEINKDYLVHFLTRSEIQQLILNYAGTTTIPDSKHGDFYKLPFLKPNQKEQILISKRLNQIDLLIKKEQTNLKKHQKIKKGLMQDLLTGKVEVTV